MNRHSGEKRSRAIKFSKRQTNLAASALFAAIPSKYKLRRPAKPLSFSNIENVFTRVDSLITTEVNVQVQKITNNVPSYVYQLLYNKLTDNFSFLFSSRAIIDIFGVTPEAAAEDYRNLLVVLHPDDQQHVLKSLRDSARTTTKWNQEFRIVVKNEIKHILANGIPEKVGKDEVVWCGVATDISEQKRLENQIRQLAFYDHLTGLPNRYLLHDRLHMAMDAGDRLRTYSAVLFIDLDNFKPLNDVYGHHAGDLLLLEAANRLKNSVRHMDTVARFGGDEFVVVLNELSMSEEESKTQALNVAEKIRHSISELFSLRTQDCKIEHHCTTSIGVTLFRGREDCAFILNQADKAMYEAKYSGRNAIRFFTK